MGSSISHKMQVEEERGVRHARKSSDVEDGDGRAEEGQEKTGKKDNSIPLLLSIVFLMLCSVQLSFC